MHEETSGVPVNFALNKPAQQSSTHSSFTATNAVDGALNTYSATHIDPVAWWTIDLQHQVFISQIQCYLNKKLRQSGNYRNFKVETRTAETDDWLLCTAKNPVPPVSPYVVKCISNVTVARYVRISVHPNYHGLFLYEVIVNGVSKPGMFLMRPQLT